MKSIILLLFIILLLLYYHYYFTIFLLKYHFTAFYFLKIAIMYSHKASITHSLTE